MISPYHIRKFGLCFSLHIACEVKTCKHRLTWKLKHCKYQHARLVSHGFLRRISRIKSTKNGCRSCGNHRCSGADHNDDGSLKPAPSLTSQQWVPTAVPRKQELHQIFKIRTSQPHAIALQNEITLWWGTNFLFIRYDVFLESQTCTQWISKTKWPWKSKSMLTGLLKMELHALQYVL